VTAAITPPFLHQVPTPRVSPEAFVWFCIVYIYIVPVSISTQQRRGVEYGRGVGPPSLTETRVCYLYYHSSLWCPSTLLFVASYFTIKICTEINYKSDMIKYSLRVSYHLPSVYTTIIIIIIINYLLMCTPSVKPTKRRKRYKIAKNVLPRAWWFGGHVNSSMLTPPKPMSKVQIRKVSAYSSSAHVWV